MNCIIVDDELMSRMAVEHCVEQTNTLNLVASCSSAMEAIKILEKEEIELIFLDVEMPGMSGLDMLKNIKSIPQVILITSKKEYAVEAFEYDVVDYIVKPVDYGRFLKAINKVKERVKAQSLESVDSESMFVKTDKRLFKINTEDILWVEALGDYVNINTVERKYIVHSTMKSIEAKLPSKHFARAHRSYIVNVDRIKVIEDTILAIEEKVIPIGQSYRKNLMEKLNIV